jgi:hypothetical protein
VPFGVGFDKTWTGALPGRLSANETFAFELLDNTELREALMEEYRPDIYKQPASPGSAHARSAILQA